MGTATPGETASAAAVRFEVLGSARAVTLGREPVRDIRLNGSTRPFQVLGLLLVSERWQLPSARLLDEIWGRGLDRAGRDLIKNAVWQLNSSLDESLGVRVIGSTGSESYELLSNLCSTDADDFERLATRLEREAETLDDETTYDLAGKALALWLGDEVLPGFNGLPSVDAYRLALGSMRLRVAKLRYAAGFQLGREVELIAALRHDVASDPYDDDLRFWLVLATASSGSRRDAIEAYDEARRQYRDAGLEPRADLQRLYGELLGPDLPTVPGGPGRAPGPAASTGERDVLTTREQSGGGTILRPLPAGRIGLVGRSAELSRLTAPVANRAGQDEDELAIRVVTGPSGIGKSCVLALVAGQATTDGRPALALRCDPNRPAALEAIDEALGSGSTGAEHQLPLHPASTLDAEAPTMPPGSPTALLERKVDAAVAVLRDRLGPDGVVTVDDAQWIDPYTLAVLEALRPGDAVDGPTVVVACPRRVLDADDEEPGKHLRAWLATRDHMVVELGPLQAPEVTALVTAAVPARHHHRVAALTDLVLRHTGGVPILVTDMVASIEREAARRGPFSVAKVESLVPGSLLGAVRRRQLRLSREAREALKAAAVGGPLVDLDVLSLVLAESEDVVAARLDECVAEALVSEDPQFGRYRFTHELLRESVLADVGNNYRARLHRQFASAVDVLRGPEAVRDRARHLLGALPLSDATEAAAVTLEAARMLIRRFDADEAIRTLHLALAVADNHEVDPRVVCDLWTELAAVHVWGGEPEAAGVAVDHALRTARALGDTTRLARAVLATGSDRRVVFADSTRIDLLAEARDRCETGTPAALAVSVQANLLIESLMPGRYRQVGIDPQDLVRRARGLGRTRPLLDALFAAHIAAKTSPELHRRSRLADELIERAADHPDLAAYQAAGFGCRLYDLLSAGRLAAMDAVLDHLEELAVDAALPRYRWRVLVVRSAVHRARDQLDAADRLSSEALALGQSFDAADASAVFGMQLHDSLWRRGSLGGLVDAMRTAARGNSIVIGHLLVAHALAHEGEVIEARQVWAGVRESALRLPPEELWLATKAMIAELSRLGVVDGGDRHAVLVDLTPFSGTWVPVGVPVATWGPVDYYLACLTDPAEMGTVGTRLLDQARRQAEAAGAAAWRDRLASLSLRL